MTATHDHPVCRHCEQSPALPRAESALGLCRSCQASKGIRELYIPRQTRRPLGPGWEAHLDRLTRRARLKLPLFFTRKGNHAG